MPEDVPSCKATNAVYKKWSMTSVMIGHLYKRHELPLKIKRREFVSPLFQLLINSSMKINKKFDVKEIHLLLLLMPPDRQRPDQGPRNSSWQRAK
ncbi:hypothetical protein TNCV_1571901 [Trichonephila clavipes]|uniref:Uncharacterized protein n=1 Tax=Trichonephila clavipes TaxID=2585209 RepID=A0A8X6VJR2_TRICX|nr:hypothetical protein TNCV_1571901 [Trichonephila clavipes]